MLKNNKGYTLAELLVSIAIFAIAMVGIISIMSNTMKAYSKANLDVSVQEDAQLVANQIEEILCDAKGSIEKSGNVYVCTNVEHCVDTSSPSGYKDYTYKYSIELDGTTLKVNSKKYDGGALIEDRNDVLAKDVKSFSIEGYNASSSVKVGQAYNEATVKISFDRKGAEYSLDRNVYFRNHVENDEFNSIKYLKNASGTGPIITSDDEYNLNVKRFEDYNLTANTQYNIKYFAKEPGTDNDIYFYTKSGDTYVADNTGANYFNMTVFDNFPNTTDYDGAKTYVLSAGDVVNSDFVNPLSGKVFYIVGYKDKALTQKSVIILHVDPVSISSDNIIQTHSGASGTGTVNDEGFVSPIEVKGINIYQAIKKGNTFTCSGTLNGSSFPDTVSLTKTNFCDVIEASGSKQGIVEFNHGKLGQWSSGQINMAVTPDPYTGGLNVRVNNEGGQHITDSGSMKFKMTISIGGEGISCPDIPFDKLSTKL